MPDLTTEAVTGFAREHYADSETVAREPQVASEINYLENAVEQLGLVVEQVEGRLRHVTRSEPDGALLREGDTESLVPLAERIKGRRETVNAITERLRNLLDRLEV